MDCELCATDCFLQSLCLVATLMILGYSILWLVPLMIYATWLHYNYIGTRLVPSYPDVGAHVTLELTQQNQLKQKSPKQHQNSQNQHSKSRKTWAI